MEMVLCDTQNEVYSVICYLCDAFNTKPVCGWSAMQLAREAIEEDCNLIFIDENGYVSATSDISYDHMSYQEFAVKYLGDIPASVKDVDCLL